MLAVDLLATTEAGTRRRALVHNNPMNRTALTAALIFASLAQAPGQMPFRVPDGQGVLFTARGVGVQIYVSQPSPTKSGAFEWVLKGPDAILLDSDGVRIGIHYAGPTWEANDGSKAVGAKIASQDSPKPGAIPWFLLKATPGGKPGIMGEVTYVIRVDTSGGAHPTRAPQHAGDQARIKYRATYIFLGAAH